jgi:DDE family transposase
MFTDDARSRVWEQVQSRGVRSFAKFMTPSVMAEAARMCKRRISANPLNLMHMVWLGVALALDGTKSFANILTVTFKILIDAPNSPLGDLDPQSDPPQLPGRTGRRLARKAAKKKRSKHHPQGDEPTRVTEEAFVQARARMPLDFWIALALLLADRFAKERDDVIRWKHFRLIALDGTLVNLPRYQALADHFGTAKGGHGGRIPQARMVMLQFPLARVPYRWTVGPKSQAERTMAEPLLNHLHKNDLLLMDRGFWSYGLFCRIVQRKAFFAIREFSQAHLKRVQRLGPKDTLVTYAPTDPKWRKLGLPEEMLLRHIVYQVRGFRPSAVITNVTDPKLISYHEWVGMTTRHEVGRVLDDAIYHRRWEIETSFRELKVSQRMKTLRGRTPGTIYYEIGSHVLLYLMVRWLMVEAAMEHGLDPLRLSFTEALGEIKDMVQTLVTASPQRIREILLPRLLHRIASHQVPLRPGRHFPRPNDTKVKNLGYGRKKLPSKLVA